jgi:hypothetical protein
MQIDLIASSPLCVDARELRLVPICPVALLKKNTYLYSRVRFGIATGYGLDDGGVGVLVPVGSRTFFSPRRPDRFGGPSSLISNGYQGLFPRGEAAGA